MSRGKERCIEVVSRIFMVMLPLVATGPASAAPPVSGERAAATQSAALAFDFRDADIRDVLRVLAEASGIALVLGDDVAGRVTLRFGASDWEEAIDTVARARGLSVDAGAGVVRLVSAAARITEYDDARRLREAREQAEPLASRLVYVRNADASVLAERIQGASGSKTTARRSLLSDRGFAFVDTAANALFLADVAERVERIVAVVAELDRLPAQVVIESEVVETSADAARALGIQWGYRGAFDGSGEASPKFALRGTGLEDGFGTIPLVASFPAPIDPAAGSALGFAWSAADGSQAAALALSALEREGKAKVISRPRVVTLNNVPATIKSLTVIRVKLPSTDTLVRTDGGGVLSPSVATEKIETGIVLVVTPRIAGDDHVVLDLFIKSSQADFSRQVDGIPTETSREATSRLVVRDGETVVLGGIYATLEDQREAGVPFLRAIPLFGWLFRGREQAARQEDLLVFITPRILANVPSSRETRDDSG